MGSAGCITCDEPLVEHTIEVLSQMEDIHKILRDINFNGGEDVTTMMRYVQQHGGQVIELVFGMPLTFSQYLSMILRSSDINMPP